MAFLNSLSISGSGLTASKLRMDIISQNITNANTTRTEEGGPYRRKMLVYEPSEQSSFLNQLKGKLDAQNFQGVKVTQIVEDTRPFKPVFKPEHPDADENGYVLMPNVDLVKENLDLLAASRAYDANVTSFNAVKSMASKALEIGR